MAINLLEAIWSLLTKRKEQDETIGAIREVSEKRDRGKEDIVTEIRSLRETFL